MNCEPLLPIPVQVETFAISRYDTGVIDVE